MPLQRDPQRVGLWTNPSQVGKAGTYAVVMGLSNYPHLIGGSAQSEQTYGLEQLAVSAVTAHAVFEWLDHHYLNSDAPLAACWLLLSPTAAELAFEPKTNNADSATFGNCELALLDCVRTLKRLPIEAAEMSRVLLFFSGHGMEVTKEHQILLPADYMGGAANPHRALSTLNLMKGLEALPLAEVLFFIDACRTRPSALASARVRGSDILLESDAPNRATQIAPIVYASATGTATWQPDSPERGPSIFGRALLEGLRAIALKDAENQLKLFPLAAYLGKRVPELLKRQGERGLVQMGNNVQDACVTEFPPQGELKPDSEPPKLLANLVQTIESDALGYKLRIATVPAAGIDPKARTWTQMHKLFGHESLTDLWNSVRMLRVGADGSAIERPHTIHRISHTGNRHLSVEISFSERGMHWLEIPMGEYNFSAVLPDDMVTLEPPRYVVEVTRDGRSVSRLDARLSTDNDGFLGAAARIWNLYETMDMARAIAVSDQAGQENVLREKGSSPLAAMIAGLFLLRVGAFDRLHDWLRNLANWFENVPDGPVLWAEQLSRDPNAGKLEQNPRAVAAHFILMAASRGLPWTCEGLGYLARQLEGLVRIREMPLDDWSTTLPALENLLSQVNSALGVFRGGGMFCSFFGYKHIVTPKLMFLHPKVLPNAESSTVELISR